jgi:hypothetical protein
VTRHGHRLPSDVEWHRRQFIAEYIAMRARHDYRDELIVNLDQTGVFFENPRLTVLARRGASQVPIIPDKLSVRATAILTVTKSGYRLNLYVIFKGVRSPRSRIGRVFSTMPPDAVYSVQSKAWTDLIEMLRYINTILVPYLTSFPGERCLLILDNFSVHLTMEVRRKLHSLRCDLLYIPQGMTGILQPLDISINKQVKSSLKNYYTQWLISLTILVNIFAQRPKPSRLLITQWIQWSWTEVTSPMIRQAFSLFQRAEASLAEPNSNGLEFLQLLAEEELRIDQ